MVDQAWWADDGTVLTKLLGSGATGLSSAAAAQRTATRGTAGPGHAALRLFIAQFTNPLVLILVFGALL